MTKKILLRKSFSDLLIIALLTLLFLAFVPSLLAQPTETVIYMPDLSGLEAGETLPDQQYFEGTGFVSDGVGGLVSTTNNEYNAIYFGMSVRQFHYHAVMEPVNPGTSIVGGLSFKTFSFEEGKRMDLAVTTGTSDKSILIYAFGMLLADNRNDAQGGLGGLSAFNTFDPVTIDLYGDRNYYAVFINEVLVIETILPLEGTGVFGIRSQNSLVRYSDIYIEKLGDTLLDGRARYYPETFETISVETDNLAPKRGEPFTVSAILEPAGKDYEDVKWYINDELTIGKTNLDFILNLNSEGTYELSCVVDRQKASVDITVVNEDYVITTMPTTTMTTTEVTTTATQASTTTSGTIDEGSDFPTVLVTGITTGVAGIAALVYFLIIRKKK